MGDSLQNTADLTSVVEQAKRPATSSLILDQSRKIG